LSPEHFPTLAEANPRTPSPFREESKRDSAWSSPDLDRASSVIFRKMGVSATVERAMSEGFRTPQKEGRVRQVQSTGNARRRGFQPPIQLTVPRSTQAVVSDKMDRKASFFIWQRGKQYHFRWKNNQCYLAYIVDENNKRQTLSQTQYYKLKGTKLVQGPSNN